MSDYIMDGSGIKRLRLLNDMGNPDVIECDGMDYVKERTCHLVNRGTAVEGCADLLLCDTCGGATYNTYPSPSYCPHCGAKVVEE